MNFNEIISIDKDILNGLPVFVGTRVPVETLFDHLEAGISINDFLDDFPSVTKAQAIALLEVANKLINTKNARQLYETIAWWKFT